MAVQVGPKNYTAVVTARGFCMIPDGPREPELERAIRDEARKVVMMSLREAVTRGGRARNILQRLEHAERKAPQALHRPEAAA
ncbi:hypothetical protein EBE87_25930 [Pseudoroseomonas wenyumeiae]|uniref:Uncharacterized protein n=1 Tax=Teichococcus wenyumeiae TaxID=2478470 RepID=A0A3A9JI51_9PROT|nr:hypothetical protein [Pseudoroseomonas wenyumeiae]RKK03314.1 hypothetical protein D6Z83_15250 [Pseudoroseomonas wenyumeiae]RMI15418.1 hypothetical protein EBE87_25930 [Pseudoroseomonas wenyumeiae]